MRSRAILLSILMLASVISPVLASDTVTTTDVEISGNHTMTGNYTVSHGTTLTIKSGATVDMGEFWMKVEGGLVATDATIMSSVQSTSPGGHNAGVWDDITITATGTASLTNVTISNAKSCLIVDGTLTATDLVLEDCLIGMEVAGTADVTDLVARNIDHDGVRLTGTVTLSNPDFTDMSQAVSSSGDLTMTSASLSSTGLYFSGGTVDVVDVSLSNAQTGVTILSGVSGFIDGMTGTATNVITSMDSTGFTIKNVNMQGKRLVNSWSAGDLTVENVDFTSTSGETVVDVRTSGTFTLTDAVIDGSFNSQQGSFSSPWIAMSLSGSGDYILSNIDVEAVNTAITSSGTGTLDLSNSMISSEGTGITLSGLSSSIMTDVTVNISNGGSAGLDILQGQHTLDNLVIEMPYNPSEADSTGLEAWWANVAVGQLDVSGFATGVELHDTFLEVEEAVLMDSNAQNLVLFSSQMDIATSLETRIADYGIQLENSTFTTRNWDASYHESSLLVSSGSTATVWGWSSLNSMNDDAIGAGHLIYSSTGFPTVSTDSNEIFWGNTVTFEDLAGNPIDADWSALGFQGTATSGTDILPLSEDGTVVTAAFEGIGVASELIGSDGASHNIQVPIIPSGDWIIPTGSDVVLGATPDGSSHVAQGDITIQNGGSLTVMDSTLSLPSGKKVTINSGGILKGTNGILDGDVYSQYSNNLNPNLEDELEVAGNVALDCPGATDSNHLFIEGDLSLGPGCDLTIYSGAVSGTVTVFTAADLIVKNTLQVTVLDKGEPVLGASVKVGGQVTTTDSTGGASRTITARSTNSGGTTWAGLITVEMQSGSLLDLYAWDSNSSYSHTFMASTISAGSLSEWLVLEKIWSPYHLSADLTIPQGQTLTIHDGVSLRVADGATITVDGILDAGSSTISSVGGGSRWGGLVIGDNTETSTNLFGTQVVEATPLITMDGPASVNIVDAILSRSAAGEPLIRVTLSSSGDLSIVNTMLSDGGSFCIEAQGPTHISITESSMSACGGDSLWLRSTPLSISSLVVEDGIDLAGVTGTVSDLTGTNLTLFSIDGLAMENLNLEGSITGIDNRDLIINGATINSAPAIDFDSTAGELSGLDIDCGGSGTGLVLHHSRSSRQMVVSDSNIIGCSKGIDLHADSDESPMNIIFREVSSEAATALASDGHGFIYEGGDLIGNLELSNTRGDIYDVTPLASTVTDGDLWMWTNHVFDSQMDGSPYASEMTMSIDAFDWSNTATGTAIQMAIPHTHEDASGQVTASQANVSAIAEGLPQMDTIVSIGPNAQTVIAISLIDNEAPSAEIIIPDDGQRVMESLPMEIRGVVSDDITANEDLLIMWSVIQSQTTIMQLSGEWNNVTDLNAGNYILKLEVTDEQGLTSEDTLAFEITLLDSDGDWLNTCDSNEWYDSTHSRKCGPDIYDDDKDGDGILNSRDSFDLDICASIDSDEDGQPDDLHCPPGLSTWLTVDDDDDGDGIPDVLEEEEGAEEGGMNPALLVVFFVIAGALAFVVMRMRREVD